MNSNAFLMFFFTGFPRAFHGLDGSQRFKHKTQFFAVQTAIFSLQTAMLHVFFDCGWMDGADPPKQFCAFNRSLIINSRCPVWHPLIPDSSSFSFRSKVSCSNCVKKNLNDLKCYRQVPGSMWWWCFKLRWKYGQLHWFHVDITLGEIYENLRERRVYVKLGAVVTLLKIYHLTNCGFSEIQCCELLKSNHFHKG